MTTPVAYAHIQPNLDQPPPGMPAGAIDFAQAEEVIATAKAAMASQKKETLTLSVDQRVTQWRKFNFTHYAPITDRLGFPAGLTEARDQHGAEAKEILTHIEKCENELAAIAIDIRRKTISPARAIAQANKIIKECASYRATVLTWQQHIKKLLDADALLREHLSIRALLPLAREVSKQSADMVVEGFAFYCMVRDEVTQPDSPTLQDYSIKASELEKRVKHLDLSGLSGIARTIIERNLQSATTATDQLKGFVEYFHKNLPGEVASVDKIQEELSMLRDATAPVILEKIDGVIHTLARNLIDLRHRAKTLKQIQLLPVVLEEAQSLHLFMKNTILPELKKRIAEPGSPVNPSTIAAEKTADFFMGASGFMRALRLLFRSMGGQRAIKANDLMERLLDILNTCEVCNGNTPTEEAKLQLFLDSKLTDFERPFPYESVCLAARETISLYASRLETTLAGFEVSSCSSDNPEEAAAPSHAISFGRLSAKLQVRAANLECARS